MTDKQAGAVGDESLADSAFPDERSNSLGKLNRSETLKKWYREPSHRQVHFIYLFYLLLSIIIRACKIIARLNEAFLNVAKLSLKNCSKLRIFSQ